MNIQCDFWERFYRLQTFVEVVNFFPREGLDYGQQSQMSNLQNTHGTFGTEASSGLAGSHQMTGLEQAVPGISNTPDVPPSIPLPNQTSMNTNANLPESQANLSQVRVHLIIWHKRTGSSRSILFERETNGITHVCDVNNLCLRRLHSDIFHCRIAKKRSITV